MDEQLLTILKLCLLALLYLFFFRVLRAVWAEVRGPKLAVAGNQRQAAPAPTAKAVKKAERKALPVQLVIVEPAALKGRTYPLAEELTVGRAAGCQVTIDDTYASQIHARVFSRDGQLFVEDLGSTNGTFVNRQKVNGPQAFRRGDRLQVGNTIMELV
jgi:pSer/pThr/pTyr-binding forkhead associated (FHA) protein